MIRTTAGLLVALLAAGGSVLAADPDGPLTLTARKQVPDRATAVTNPATDAGATFKSVSSEVRLDPKKTAVVICDMWDDHWCKSAAARCGELAKKADPVLKACRERGMTIVHAPSDCMKFYEDHPARKRMLAIRKVALPKEKEVACPPLPIDDSDGGCDDDKPARQFKAWTREHPAITIDPDRDYVSDNGHEVYSMMKEKGITTLLVMGVHTNMCVLNRTFAIKQMVKWGVEVYLIRDLTDAMYNPKMKPNVSHEQGTGLVIEFIERYWCPTIQSNQLLAGK